jgi:hypothetical protein
VVIVNAARRARKNPLEVLELQKIIISGRIETSRNPRER